MENEFISLVTLYEIDNTFDSDKFLKLRLRVMHDGLNAKNINFPLEAIKNAAESIKNIPILANVVFDDENKPDYSGHDIHIESDYNNKLRNIYDETPIGLVPEICNYELKEEDGRSYVFVDGYIWKDYSNYAEDVILNKKNVSLSMEVKYTDLTFNNETNVYDANGYKYRAITLLGENHSPAMEKANASLETFEEDIDVEKFELMKEELQGCLSKYSKEGGTSMEKDHEKATNTNVDEKIENFESLYSSKYEAANKAILKYDPEHGYVSLNDMSDEYVYFTVVEYDKDYENRTRTTFRVAYSYNTDSNVLSIDDTTKEQVILKFVTLAESSKIDEERKELFELREYKETNEKEKFENSVKSIFAKFEDQLKDSEEFKNLKNNYSDMTVDQIEKECYALFGLSKFSVNNKQKKVNFVSTKLSEPHVSKADDDYGGILVNAYNEE